MENKIFSWVRSDCIVLAVILMFVFLMMLNSMVPNPKSSPLTKVCQNPWDTNKLDHDLTTSDKTNPSTQVKDLVYGLG